MRKIKNFIYKWGWLYYLNLSIACFALWFSQDDNHKSNTLIYQGVLTLASAIGFYFFPTEEVIRKNLKVVFQPNYMSAAKNDRWLLTK